MVKGFLDAVYMVCTNKVRKKSLKRKGKGIFINPIPLIMPTYKGRSLKLNKRHSVHVIGSPNFVVEQNVLGAKERLLEMQKMLLLLLGGIRVSTLRNNREYFPRFLESLWGIIFELLHKYVL